MTELPEPIKVVNVTGFLIGVYVDTEQPVFFMLEGIQFLPIFSTVEKYEQAMRTACLPGPAKIKKITDHAEFLDSVNGKVRLMLDPWLTERGTTRFTELRLDEEP